jgi:hypothetical protein
MGKTLLALCTPKRFSLSPGSSDSIRRIDEDYQYCPSPSGSYFHAYGIECRRCCDWCRMGELKFFSSGRADRFFVELCRTHYAELMEYAYELRMRK